MIWKSIQASQMNKINTYLKKGNSHSLSEREEDELQSLSRKGMGTSLWSVSHRLPPGTPHLCLLEAEMELSQKPVQQQHSCNSCKYGWRLQRLPSFMGIKGENKKQCCNVLPGYWNCCLQKPQPEYLSSQPLMVSENIQHYTDFTVKWMIME